MTIVTGTTRAAELAAAGTLNNPLVLWENVATISNISSPNGVEPGGPAANAVTGTTYDAATPTVVSNSTTLEVTGSGLTASAGAIYAHNIGTIGANVRIQYSNDGGSTWNDSGAGVVSPADDQAILWRFDERSEDDWRLVIDSIPGGEQPIIGGFILGVEIVFEQRLYQGYRPPITPTEVELIDNTSAGQHLLGTRAVLRGSTITASLQHITAATLRDVAWTDFQRHFNNGGGFIWAWRPTKHGDAHWCWRQGATIAPANDGPQSRMGFTMQMRAYDE